MRVFLLAAVLRIGLDDLPEPMQALFPDLPGFLQQQEAEAARRLEEGEWDHLVFYVLQSSAFTERARIEPAVSARAFHQAAEIPDAVMKRFRDFTRSKVGNPRITVFRRLGPHEARFRQEYGRAMRFLYAKEVESLAREGQARREEVAGLYQTRGHSSDTGVEANYAVHVALSAVKQRRPDWRARRVLIVGPGLDFAPRTGLREEAPPESYQPYAVLDSLRALGLAAGDATVQCVDLNPRVVENFERAQPALHIGYVSEEPGLREYLAGLGSQVGVRKGPVVALRVPGIRATRLNIVTSRLAERFDLVVATNVLLYLEAKPLALALTNLRHMLNENGLLIHNDTRAEAEAFARVLGLPVFDARMVRLSATRQLYDTAVVHSRP